MHRIVETTLLVAVLLPAGLAAAPPGQERVLDNGLKVVVQEDHRAPVVVSQVWYRVGSSYEQEGTTGLSHVLEHMMFQGTQRHGAGELSRIIAENGGEENAFTGADYTAYFQKLERSRYPVSLELEADRMQGLVLSQKEFDKEIKVVMEERRLRTEDDPKSLLYETAMAMAFQTSPYRNPVIGWMSDLQHMSTADLRRWYEQWYLPGNAILVVAGDVQPQEVFKAAEQHFGPLPKRDLVPVKPRPEVAQSGLRRVNLRTVARLPYLLLAYKVPVLKNAVEDPARVREAEIYALEVLAGVLDGGASARLSRYLVRERRIAATAGAHYDPHDRLESLFVFDGVPAEGKRISDVEEALRAEVAKLREQLVAPEELRRIKTQVIANEVYQRDSVFYQAMQIGLLESVGLPWRLKDQYVDRIKAVTAEQVREVARKYLIDDRLTVATLEPLPAAPGQGG